MIYVNELINKIHDESNIETMSRIPDKLIDGIITSPPYNLQNNPNHRRLDQDDYHLYLDDVDNLSESDYLKVRLNEFREFDRIIKSDGVICYNISYSSENPMLPLLLMNQVHERTNLTVTEIISWKKSSASPFQTSPNKLTRIVELIYVIVHKEFLDTFKANKEIASVNQNTGQNFYKNYTNFITARNNDGFESKLKASFSTELVRKLIQIYFSKNSIIYDPFMGIGTTALGCIKEGCNYIGSEIQYEIYKDAVTRVGISIKSPELNF